MRVVHHLAVWAAWAAILGTASCAERGAGRPGPMGRLPDAVTTAEPEWMPLAVRAGRPVADDPREGHWAETRRVTEGLELRQLAWAPSSTKLVFAAERPGAARPTAELVDLATGRRSTLSRPEESVTSLRFLDEQHVVFVAAAAERRFLVTTGLDGTDRRTLELSADPVAVAPSPGAEALWLQVQAREGHAVGRASRAGGGLRIVATDVLGASAPDASPGRSTIAFVGADGALRLASDEGRGVRVLPRETYGRAQHPAFDAAGARLYFTSDLDTVGGELYRVEVEPTSWPPRAERLSFAHASLGAPSPDGRLVAFASRRAGPTSDLYVARLGARR